MIASRRDIRFTPGYTLFKERVMPFTQQVDIGPVYRCLTREETLERIAARKAELADRLLILCHHYQQDDVHCFADLTGDSLKLAREAAGVADKTWLVFCGVHFMAESADILAREDQAVLLPHLAAGCPMADMASRPALIEAWRQLGAILGAEALARIIPITYVNSSAAVKAFVGEQGGAVCTSANAERVLAWALARGERAFFVPDQHLGRNSAIALGIGDEELALWRRGEPGGGNSDAVLRRARVLLWDGGCEVHLRYQPDHVLTWRRRDPHARVIVHPESRHEVLRLADQYGSTEAIIAAVAGSAPGSHWVIGTEVNLVRRLARQYPDRRISELAPACLCPTMDLVDPVHLLWILDQLAQGQLSNRVRVAPDIARPAALALERMLAI